MRKGIIFAAEGEDIDINDEEAVMVYFKSAGVIDRRRE